MMRCVTLRRLADNATDFDRTTELVPAPGLPGDFSVELDPGWSSLVGVHGGYMCAIAVRAAETLAADRSVRTVATSFLRPGRVGAATVSVRELRRGRSFTTMSVDLCQEGQPLITSRMTLLTERSGVEWSTPAPTELPPPEACVRMDVGRVSHFDQLDGLLDPASLPFSSGDRATVRGYLRPHDDRPVDPAWLAMASDWFPPPAFVRLEPPTGGVSIDLTTHIHQAHLVLGDDEWLTGTFTIETSTAGLAVEHGHIARRDGTLVAESFQTRLTATD
jgi:acyl-CoA thioesterase